MNELIPTIATKKALMSETTTPAASAARTPIAMLVWFATVTAITPETAKVLATLRSSSPIRITAVRPRATRPISAILPSVTWYAVKTRGWETVTNVAIIANNTTARPSVRLANTLLNLPQKPVAVEPTLITV